VIALNLLSIDEQITKKLFLFLGHSKQISLLYVLMTRRRAAGYIAVFNKLKQLLGSVSPSVKYVMSDFETAIWSAVSECFPAVKHVGCNFHWTQAVMKKVSCAY
jgi:transposase-like protein